MFVLFLKYSLSFCCFALFFMRCRLFQPTCFYLIFLSVVSFISWTCNIVKLIAVIIVGHTDPCSTNQITQFSVLCFSIFFDLQHFHLYSLQWFNFITAIPSRQSYCILSFLSTCHSCKFVSCTSSGTCK